MDFVSPAYTLNVPDSLGNPVASPNYRPLALAPLRLLEATGLAFDAPVLHVGADDTCFVPALLDRGYANILVVDKDPAALDGFRRQLPPEQADRVLWVVDEVSNPQHVVALEPVLLWHDRTCVQQLASADQRAGYRRLLNHMVGAHGWVLLGIQRPKGPTDADQLATFLGPDYSLRHILEEIHLTPPGEPSPVRYALFKRNETRRQGPWVNL